MSVWLPTELDFDPLHGDLDAQCAWRNFGGLTLDEAHAKNQFEGHGNLDVLPLKNPSIEYYSVSHVSLTIECETHGLVI
jgi:hypothetical protein